MDPLTLSFPTGDLAKAIPILIPAVFGLGALLADLLLRPGRSKAPLAIIAVAGSILAAVAALGLWRGEADTASIGGTLVTSGFSAALALAVLLPTALMALAAVHHGQTADGATRPGTLAHGEFFGLLLFAASGMLALVVSNDLVTFFVAIETLSIAVYALSGLDRRRPRSAEVAMKCFVLWAFSSGFLLYGMSLLYGATGTLELTDMPLDLGENRTLASTGAVLVLVGLLFKVAAVPFHSWSPDAYEGAPSSVTGFMSVGVKVAAFGGMLRVVSALGGESGAIGPGATWTLWLIAALTVIAGNAGALTQRNPRRLLAYSSIAHSGYVLIGVIALARALDPHHPAAGPELQAVGSDAVAGVLFYLLAYGVSNVAAFAVLCHLERDGEEIEDVGELAGLSKKQPGVAFVMTLAMLSLAGVPATAGFLGKLWVFRAGVAAGDVGLVVLALLTSALSAFYYLRVVVVMYMAEPGQALAKDEPAPLTRELAPDTRRWCSRFAVTAAGVLIVVLGLMPGRALLDLVTAGGRSLAPTAAGSK